MNKVLMLVGLISCCLSAASEILTREQLIAEIATLERIIKSCEPKVTWWQHHAEDLVWNKPLSPEANEAVGMYGQLLAGLGNAKKRLERMKKELMDYDVREIVK